MTADQLRETLHTLGYTQRNLACLLGVDNATVNRWCQGTLKVPRYVESYLDVVCRQGDHDAQQPRTTTRTGNDAT
jgi:DNA-binding transcriptional regulator YiaG